MDILETALAVISLVGRGYCVYLMLDCLITFFLNKSYHTKNSKEGKKNVKHDTGDIQP